MKRLFNIILFFFSFVLAQGQDFSFFSYPHYVPGASAEQLEQRAANFFRWNHNYHHYDDFVWVRTGHHVGDWVKKRHIGPIQSHGKTFDVSYDYYLSISCEEDRYTVHIKQLRVTAKRKSRYLLSWTLCPLSYTQPFRYNKHQVACFEAAKEALNDEVANTLVPLLQRYMQQDGFHPDR